LNASQDSSRLMKRVGDGVSPGLISMICALSLTATLLYRLFDMAGRLARFQRLPYLPAATATTSSGAALPYYES
jgi:hypothetical protein